MWLRATIGIVTCIIALYAKAYSSAETFRDSLGREISLNSVPKRIVTLAPSLTEILFFLGLENRIVGVTTFSNYPEEASLKPRVGSYINLNPEKIISLAPDLVLGTADGNSEPVVDLLEKAGMKVFVVNPRNVEETIGTILTVGNILGVTKNAEERVTGLRKRIRRVQKMTECRERPRVFMQINLKPIMTINRDTFLHDLIRVAGGNNIFGNEPISYPRISLEEVIERQPEVIIITSMDIGGTFEKARSDWLKWRSMPAARDGRVHLIDSDIANRPSPRIVEALEKMAGFIHPPIVSESVIQSETASR
jgi:iron complex transport system substrate-binding protein